jgi:glycerol-3-phosphate acyltransferase PlsY
VLLAARFGEPPALVAGLGAFLGHVFPVWLGFKGGKGVATYLGVLIGLYWPAAAIFAGTWLLVDFVTRYSSLAALTAVVASVLALAAMGEWRLAALFLLLGGLLYVRHAANIGRLARGEETRIGETKR